MSNLINIDSAMAPVALDFSKLGGVLASFRSGEFSPMAIDLNSVALPPEALQSEGVTINGVNYKFSPVDLSNLALVNFGEVQLHQFGDSIFANSLGEALPANNTQVWQVPSVIAGAFIELNLADIDLTGISFGVADFHSFVF